MEFSFFQQFGTTTLRKVDVCCDEASVEGVWEREKGGTLSWVFAPEAALGWSCATKGNGITESRAADGQRFADRFARRRGVFTQRRSVKIPRRLVLAKCHCVVREGVECRSWRVGQWVKMGARASRGAARRCALVSTIFGESVSLAKVVASGFSNPFSAKTFTFMRKTIDFGAVFDWLWKKRSIFARSSMCAFIKVRRLSVGRLSRFVYG